MINRAQLDKHLFPILATSIGLVIVFVRYRYLEIPFERDEGEYAYGAQMLLSGEQLYGNVYSLKWPGIFLVYAFIISIFGATIWGVHFGLLVVHLLTTFVVYRLCRTYYPHLSSSLAALSFMIFMVQKEIQGIMANSEHFVIFFLSISLLLFFRYRSKKHNGYLVWAGIFSGLAFLTKQHAIGYLLGIAFVLIFLKLHHSKNTFSQKAIRLSLYGGGVAAPFVLVLIWILLFDDFDRFWFHTFTYAREYVGLTTYEEGWFELKKRIIENFSVNPFLWAFATFGVFTLNFLRPSKYLQRIFYPLLIGSLMAISLGLYFRPHYVMFLPLVLSLFLAHFYHLITKWKSSLLALMLFVVGSLTYFIIDREYLFQWDHNWTSNRLYYGHPFREAVKVGEYLSKNSEEGDEVLVVGAEPQINFYSQRKSVTGYIYTYPFFENHPFVDQMSDEWMEEIRSNPPKYIVLMGHWITYIDRENEIFKKIWDFSTEFIENGNYQRVGIVDIPIDDGIAVFGLEVKNREPESENWIYVYEKQE